MLEANPNNIELKFRAADVASWIGRAAEYDGRLGEARSSFAEMTAGYEALCALEPNAARWQLSLAQSLIFSGSINALIGEPKGPMPDYTRARSVYARLIAGDPKNRQWQVSVLDLELQRAGFLIARGDTATAGVELGTAREKLEALVIAEPSSRAFKRHLAEALRMEALVNFSVAPASAEATAARAVTLGEELLAATQPDAPVRRQLARSRLLAGRIAEAAGRHDPARRHWLRALEVLGADLDRVNDWRLLDPAMQALSLLGRTAEAQSLAERLRRFGYHSTDPFAAALLAAASKTESSVQPP